MTNRPNGTLYVGVTGNLQRRVWGDREGVADGFTMQYGLKRLVMPNGIKISGLQYRARVTEALAADLESSIDPRDKPITG